jgi:hypothetical protein
MKKPENEDNITINIQSRISIFIIENFGCTYKDVMTNYWTKCIYAPGLVFRTEVLNLQVPGFLFFFFLRSTKALSS